VFPGPSLMPRCGLGFFLCAAGVPSLMKDGFMAEFDWDKWNQGWSLGLPKNEMWSKIRSGKNDESGEPIYLVESAPNVESSDPVLAGVIAEHRFVTFSGDDLNHCFCGWSGESHGDHLFEKVVEFTGQGSAEPVTEPVEEPVKPVRKAAVKKVAE
jgi:hypothetical protein